ncbi:hypothetical protein P4H10_10050 [Bacillus cereus]|nr:hypothetical protein [Bacillus cereus]
MDDPKKLTDLYSLSSILQKNSGKVNDLKNRLRLAKGLHPLESLPSPGWQGFKNCLKPDNRVGQPNRSSTFQVLRYAATALGGDGFHLPKYVNFVRPN